MPEAQNGELLKIVNDLKQEIVQLMQSNESLSKENMMLFSHIPLDHMKTLVNKSYEIETALQRAAYLLKTTPKNVPSAVQKLVNDIQSLTQAKETINGKTPHKSTQDN